MNGIIQWDRQLFDLLHNQLTHPILDFLMPILTDLNLMWWFQFIVFPALLFLWYRKTGPYMWRVFGGTIVAILITDAISHNITKPSVGRQRPEFAGLEVNLKTRSHTGFSFTSNHAANNFAAATSLTLASPAAWPFFILATAVAYSRVYVGVHFPLDVTGGAIFGSFIAFLMSRIYFRTGFWKRD